MWMSNFGHTGMLHDVGTYVTLVFLILYIAFFAVGMSSTPWSVNTEIYPIHLIGTATAFATATNWLSNFVVSSTFLSIMSTDVGKVVAFVLLAMFGVGGFIFIYFLLPETNDRPITENVKNILEGNV